MRNLIAFLEEETLMLADLDEAFIVPDMEIVIFNPIIVLFFSKTKILN